MRTEVKYSSKRLLMSLALCACAVILLQNYNVSAGLSFAVDLFCVLTGLAVCFLCFLPAVVIKKRFGSDVLSLVSRRSKAERIAVTIFFAVYSVYAALYFLIPYTDMFCKKYYPDASPCMIGLLLLVCCVYAAFKGANAITRFGLFLFVLAMLTNILMFAGSVSSLDFDSSMWQLRGDVPSFLQNAVFFSTPCFAGVIFSCLAGDTVNFKLRHPVIAIGLTGVKFALVLFFIAFAVGEYAQRQEYQTFVLSRVAHFGSFTGVESFYMALSTMSVFMIISLLLCCVGKAAKKSESLPFVSYFAAAVFLLRLLAYNNNSVKEIFTDPLVFTVFSVTAAAVLPCVYLIRERSRHA